ncbi:MAG: hypothetical protein GY939_10950, partial [Actinomycetia bacterium]|nr:hypothetical protein [Actinomycetes bacterium]
IPIAPVRCDVLGEILHIGANHADNVVAHTLSVRSHAGGRSCHGDVGE